MKSLAVTVLLVGAALAFSQPKPEPSSRGCVYIHGTCVRECEEGTTSYNSNCDYLMPEATCDQPYPERDMSGPVCDFSACYCDYPTIRDPVTNKCVAIEECTRSKSFL